MGKKLFSLSFLVNFLATGFFGSYLIPFAPGFWGMILGGILAYFTRKWSLIYKLILFFAVLILAIPLSSKSEEILNKGKDPHLIVIDEVCAMLFLSLFFDFFKRINIFGLKVPLILVIFLIYGIFDSIKIFLIPKIENLPRGWGIVFDDIMAGVYTVISILIIFKII